MKRTFINLFHFSLFVRGCAIPGICETSVLMRNPACILNFSKNEIKRWGKSFKKYVRQLNDFFRRPPQDLQIKNRQLTDLSIYPRTSKAALRFRMMGAIAIKERLIMTNRVIDHQNTDKAAALSIAGYHINTAWALSPFFPK